MYANCAHGAASKVLRKNFTEVCAYLDTQIQAKGNALIYFLILLFIFFSFTKTTRR